MIIHKLIASFFRVNRSGANKEFFLLQALDTVLWLRRWGVKLEPDTKVLDLGCGFGEIGGEIARLGCQVTLADDDSFVRPEYANVPFRRFNIDRDDFQALGEYDLVICSNVLEHLSKPERLMAAIPKLIKPDGSFYLSWTNWLSPYGGHEYAPFHYLGSKFAGRVKDKWLRGPRSHTIYKDLFPTYIGATLGQIQANPQLRVTRRAPRYYPELAFIMYLPLLREFLAWNCVIMVTRRS
jgi:2-polyprenyl-3-methyl-5-hydroxy-6-metoxy-1,4-benzoquinol methylase